MKNWIYLLRCYIFQLLSCLHSKYGSVLVVTTLANRRSIWLITIGRSLLCHLSSNIDYCISNQCIGLLMLTYPCNWRATVRFRYFVIEACSAMWQSFYMAPNHWPIWLGWHYQETSSRQYIFTSHRGTQAIPLHQRYLIME